MTIDFVDESDARLSIAMGAAAHTALLNGVSRRIENVHERDGAAGHTVCRTNHRAAGTKFFKSEAGAATGLMNDRGISCGLHDAGDRVWHIEYKACGELTVGFAGIDETRRVGNEFARHHDVGHPQKKFIALFRICFGYRDMRHYA